jgi:hypothetical protein
LMVLHTWNQELGHHPHVHAVVPGGGPSQDGKRWVTSERGRSLGGVPGEFWANWRRV